VKVFLVSFSIGGRGIGWRIWFCYGRRICSSCRWCIWGLGSGLNKVYWDKSEMILEW